MEIWSLVYERPDVAKTGFGRAVWCLSKVFSEHGAKTHIIYNMLENGKAVEENIGNITLHGILTSGWFPSRRINFYKSAFQIINHHYDENKANVFFLHGAFALPLSKPLQKLGGLIAYHTFGSLINELERSFNELMRSGE